MVLRVRTEIFFLVQPAAVEELETTLEDPLERSFTPCHLPAQPHWQLKGDPSAWRQWGLKGGNQAARVSQADPGFLGSFSRTSLPGQADRLHKPSTCHPSIRTPGSRHRQRGQREAPAPSLPLWLGRKEPAFQNVALGMAGTATCQVSRFVSEKVSRG